MKIAKLLGERFKNAGAECTIDSHALMVRGGYIKSLGAGIYSLYTPANRIAQKIENIMRQEMDAIDGQEVLFPVVMPANIWRESGRYQSVGAEMLRFKDRNNSDMLLGMTHEEAAVQLARDCAKSYTKYPFMIYQIQTKFRDEPRSRGGLIRTREFTMKDAYSFHTSQQDLEDYYEKCYKAYERIYARCGVPQVVAVKADTGMMGGSVSHEFMLLTDIGEDSIVICKECDYRANMEVADCVIDAPQNDIEELKLVHTQNAKTIEDVCKLLNVDNETSCKAVMYQKNSDDTLVIVFIRGDLEVNETKLRNVVGDEVHPATITPEMNIHAGFVGPKDLPEGVVVVYDESLKEINSLVAGANKVDYHYAGLNIARDCGAVTYVSVAKAVENGICPVCGKHSITISRGVEVGNIFQLGTKYTVSMNMQYLDKNGELQYPIMGCYGIGVGRLMASICQVSHDEFGPIWPMSIAPWQVHICAMRVDDDNVRTTADKLYKDLTAQGIEVLYDDREVSVGVMFSDADLLGVPLRVIVSPRSLGKGVVELNTRDKSFTTELTVDTASQKIADKVQEMLKKYDFNNEY